jgi:alcohol dehydrogenase (cytochrome c)
MVGTIGRAAGGKVIVALDAATGKEAWRFHVIARPGEPGGNSWNGLRSMREQAQCAELQR